MASTDKTPLERLQELLDEECDCPAFALDTNLGDRCADLLRLAESELPSLLARERELTEAVRDYFEDVPESLTGPKARRVLSLLGGTGSEQPLGIAQQLRDLHNEVDCRIEHGAESGGHLEYVRGRLAAVLNSEEPKPKLHCGYCGYVGWTIEHYGRVTHKESCPARTDPWCQTHPKGCPVNSEEPGRG